MTQTTLNLDADLIDIRDIIERVEELEDARDNYTATNRDGYQTMIGADWHVDRPEEAQELQNLTAILEELKGNGGDEKWRGDWYPVTLISEDYFTAYIQDLIDDCYEMPKEINSGAWPYRHMTIDYEAAAEEAKQDYSEIDIGGTAYLYR